MTQLSPQKYPQIRISHLLTLNDEDCLSFVCPTVCHHRFLLYAQPLTNTVEKSVGVSSVMSSVSSFCPQRQLVSFSLYCMISCFSSAGSKMLVVIFSDLKTEVQIVKDRCSHIFWHHLEAYKRQKYMFMISLTPVPQKAVLFLGTYILVTIQHRYKVEKVVTANTKHGSDWSLCLKLF